MTEGEKEVSGVPQANYTNIVHTCKIQMSFIE